MHRNLSFMCARKYVVLMCRNASFMSRKHRWGVRTCARATLWARGEGRGPGACTFFNDSIYTSVHTQLTSKSSRANYIICVSAEIYYLYAHKYNCCVRAEIYYLRMHINVLFVYAQKYITCICTEVYHLCVQGNILLLCVEMHHLCRGSILGGARARLCGRGVWAGFQAHAQFYNDDIHTSVHTQSSPKHCPVLNFGGDAGPNTT